MSATKWESYADYWHALPKSDHYMVLWTAETEARAMNRAFDVVMGMACGRVSGTHPYYNVLGQELRAAARAIVQDQP